MDVGERGLDQSQLQSMSTVELMGHAVTEMKMLVRAEVLCARHELQEELTAARRSGILLGAGAALAVVGVTLLFVAVALALPVAAWLGALIVALGALVGGGLLGLFGVKAIPRKVLPRTLERLKADWTLAREQVQ